MTQIEADLDETLRHYGVPGMKWGVRRRAFELDEEFDKRVRNRQRLVKAAAYTGAIAATYALNKSMAGGSSKSKPLSEVLTGVLIDKPRTSSTPKAKTIIDGFVVSDIYDHQARGSDAVRAITSSTWKTPIRELTSG